MRVSKKLAWEKTASTPDGNEHFVGQIGWRKFAGYTANRQLGVFLPTHARKVTTSETEAQRRALKSEIKSAKAWVAKLEEALAELTARPVGEAQKRPRVCNNEPQDKPENS